MFSFKESLNLASLETLFSLDEIKQVVFDLGADNALGPDRFPIFFFQKHWSLVKDDLVNLCTDFFEGRGNLERLNWVNMVLIAKKNSPENILDFHLISLINFFCKIISKLFANRLSKVINDLVDDS